MIKVYQKNQASDYLGELEIVQGFNKRDSRALTHLFNLLNRPLCHFAFKIILSNQDAEDIVSEAFLKLWRRNIDFASIQSIKSYLFTSVKNTCIDFLKAAKRQKKVHKEILYLFDEKEPTQDALIRFRAESEILQTITVEIENLPGKCRTIFKKIFYEGMSTAAISYEMKISKQNVLNQKARAISLLQIVLQEKNIAPVLLLQFLALEIAVRN